MSASNSPKDVLYIDIDEEITSIIDKVRSSHDRIVALVLPKRATVFQSIVNMKLLKRTADESKKRIVLITSENGLLPLAGSVGLYVAKNLQTKPEIPSAPEEHDELPEVVDEETADDPSIDKARSLGELAGGRAAGIVQPPLDEDETIDFDNVETPVAAAVAAAGKSKKKDRKFKIPDFNKFRLLLVAGGAALVLLIIGLYMAIAVLPKATVSVKTDSSAINNGLDLSINTAAKEVDAKAGIIPAQLQQTQKTLTQQVEATGQVDKGTPAGGTVVLKNCGSNEVSIPAGTAVSANGLTFITQKKVDLDDGIFFGACKAAGDHIATVNVVSQQAGEKYNVAPTTYAVAGYSNVSGTGSQMAGGTSNIVKTVSQADIDNAKQKISAQDANPVKDELKKALTEKGLFPIVETLALPNPEVVASSKPGDEAATVTITQKTTYTMLGVKEDDLKKVITDAVGKKIDTKKQTILDYGIDKAIFAKQNDTASGSLVALQITSIVGSDIDVNTIKKQVAGKKAATAKDIIKSYPGVTEVNVKYSPFWVSSIPKKTSKITIQIEEPKASNDKSN